MPYYPYYTVADGQCQPLYNTAECGYDQGDCDEFNELYPGCVVEQPLALGNGYCNGGDYDTAECGYDGGDCMPWRNAHKSTTTTMLPSFSLHVHQIKHKIIEVWLFLQIFQCRIGRRRVCWTNNCVFEYQWEWYTGISYKRRYGEFY